MASETAGPGANAGASLLCGICRTPVGPDDARAECPRCGAGYHQECWQENGGCAVYGCPQAPPTEKWQGVDIPPAHWGQERKPCPQCGTEILAAALRCRQCGTVFASSDPQSAEDFQRRKDATCRRDKARTQTVWMFALSVFPFTAPVAFVWGLFWRAQHREELAALPSLHAALSTIGIWVSGVQTVLLLLGALVAGLTLGS